MTNQIPTKQPDLNISGCSYSRTLEIISNKWTALVIYALEDGSIRYGDMRRQITGISKKMLTQTLRQLERDGLVNRFITPAVPPIVEYSLTPLGETLILPLRQLKEWSMAYYSDVEKARKEYDSNNEKNC